MKRILVAGKTALDVILKGFRKEYTERSTNNIELIALALGGSAFNVAAGASHPFFSGKVSVSILTSLGGSSDNHAAAAKQYFEKNKITLHELPGEGGLPIIAVTIAPDGERTFFSGRNGKIKTDPRCFAKPEFTKLLRDHDVLVLAGLTPDSPFGSPEMASAIADAKETNPDLIVVADVIAVNENVRGDWPAIRMVLEQVNWFVPSDDEIKQIIPVLQTTPTVPAVSDLPFTRQAEMLLNKYPEMRLVAIKCGERGAEIHQRQPNGTISSQWIKPAYRGTVVDKTGAGDAWVAGFVAGAILKGSNSTPDTTHGARVANAVARCCIMYEGANSWISATEPAQVNQLLSIIHEAP